MDESPLTGEINDGNKPDQVIDGPDGTPANEDYMNDTEDDNDLDDDDFDTDDEA